MKKREKSLPNRITVDESPQYEGKKKNIFVMFIKAEPDLTLEALQARFHRGWGVFFCLATLSNTLNRLGLRRKKSNIMPPKKRADKFLDETGANLNMSLAYGRASSHQRVYADKPVARG